MNTKSKKKLLILGSSTALIATTIFSVAATTGSNSGLPPTITGQTDYFTDERNADIEKVISQIGLSEDSFLDKAQNENFKLINSWRQFDVANSNITIDDLITRVKTLQTVGLFGFNGTSLDRFNLDEDIERLTSFKNQAEADLNNQTKVDEIYKQIGRDTRTRLERVFDSAPAGSTAAQIKAKKVENKLKIDFQEIKELYDLNKDLFREFAFEYIKHWLEDSNNSDLYNRKSLSVTLATTNTVNRNRINYTAGSLSKFSTADEWSNNSDITGANKFIYSGAGTIITTYPTEAETTRNVAFVKENLSVADFVMFQLIASGEFQGDETKTAKLVESFERNTSRAISFVVNGHTLRTSSAINRDGLGRPFLSEYVDNYYVRNVYLALGGRTFTITKPAPASPATPASPADPAAPVVPAVPAVPAAPAAPVGGGAAAPDTGTAAPVVPAGDTAAPTTGTDASATTPAVPEVVTPATITITKSYDDVLADDTYPNPTYYLAKAKQPISQIRQRIFRIYELRARKYFIERFYAGQDTDLLNVNNIPVTASERTQLGNTKAPTLYNADTYNIIKSTPLIGHGSGNFATSLSFKWFVATHYDKNGAPFTINRGEGFPEFAKIRDFQYNPNDHEVLFTNVGSALDTFRQASDRMIYDYIEHVARINNFNLQDPISNEIFKNLYRLIRSVISFETTWTRTRNDRLQPTPGINLNGYNQDSSKPSNSELLVVTSGMSVRFYVQLIQTIENAITDATIAYAKNPSQSQLESLSNIFSFYQLYINPLQFNVDATRKAVSDLPERWRPLLNFISTNFPNFGVARLNGNNLLNRNEVLTGRSVPYGYPSLTAGERGPEFIHTNLFAEWKRLEDITSDADVTKQKFEKFKEWFINVKLRNAIKVLTLNASAPAASTQEINKIDIFGQDFVIDPKYALGRVFGSLEYTNNAVLRVNNAKLDEIPVTDLKALNLNSTDSIRTLGLPNTFNIDNDLNLTNRLLFNKEYFKTTEYSAYLTKFKERRNTKKIIPIIPDITSPLYANNYMKYSNDYNSYLAEFYTNDTKDTIRLNAELPLPPAIYINISTENSNSYFENYQNFINYLELYNLTETRRRNLALRSIKSIPLNTQEDTTYIVTLSDGTLIRNASDWVGADGAKKVTTTNPITKIELGMRRVVVAQNSPYIIWNHATDRSMGISRILPGPNGISVDPEVLTERITVRNLLIKQLQDRSIADYTNIYNSVNTWYTAIRSEINPSAIINLNSKFQALQLTNGTLATIDGYTIAKPETSLIQDDPKYPWDNSTNASSNLNPDISLFKKLKDFVVEVQASRNRNVNVLSKVRELTLDLIKKSLSNDSDYTAALATLNSVLDGTKVVNSSGALIDPTEGVVKLETNFPNVVNAAKEAIDSVDALRKYKNAEVGFTFSNYNNSLTRVSDVEYRQAISTVSLIFEYGRYNSHVFNYDSISMTAKPISKEKWGFVNTTFTPDELSSIEKYNAAVDTKTTSNTAFKFFTKFFSPADPDSLAFITDRNLVVNTIQDLYTAIGTPGSGGAASYNPATNTNQNAIDNMNPELVGDIINILPNQRASLANRYFEAANSLERIKIQTANLTALRSTKAALDFVYVNARVTAGKFDRSNQTLAAGFTPYFGFDNATKNVNSTRNAANKAVVLVNTALRDVNALNGFSTIKNDADGYLSALAAISELIKFEQELISTSNTSFDKAKWLAFDSKLVDFTEKLDSGFSVVPKYQDTSTENKTFTPIVNASLRTLLLQKIQYLQFLAGSIYVKDNFITSFDTDNNAINPSTTKPEWDKYVKTLKQLGKSAVGYRLLTTERQNALNNILAVIFPVINLPNKGTDSATSARAIIGTNTPTLQNVNALRSILDSLVKTTNSVALLQTQYDTDAALKSALKVGENHVTPAALVFDSIIDQTKNFLDIHKSENNDNSSFSGAATVTPDSAKAIVKKLALNEFLTGDIENQLRKLQNIKDLHNIVLRIKTFRDDYLTNGVLGASGRTPEQLKAGVSADIFSLWEAEDNKVKALLDSGTIPLASVTFPQLNSNATTKVNLAPGLDASNNLISVALAGNDILTNYATIKTNLEKLESDLTRTTSALNNNVTANQLVPLLNELNGNPTTITDRVNVYNETANVNNPNNIVFAVDPALWTTTMPANSGTAVPAPTIDSTSAGTSSLKNFNIKFKSIDAFTDKANLTELPYEDLLEIATTRGKGPTSLRTGGSNQNDINTVISHLNNQMFKQVMNAIYWANTDFLFLQKFRELLLEEENSTLKLSNSQFIKTRKNTFDKAFADAVTFFKTEAAKTDGAYVLVDGFDSTVDLNGKIPLMNFANKFKNYGADWKNLIIKYVNSDLTKQNEYRSKGFVLETLSKLASATDTSGRASYIAAYTEYLTSRNALNGTISEVSSTTATKETITKVYNETVAAIDNDWETRTYTRATDITLQDVLKRAKIITQENTGNKFVAKETVTSTLAQLKSAFASKKEADNNTRVSVISRLPEITNRISTIIKSTELTLKQKIEQLTSQTLTLADSIGVKKDAGTGVLNTEKTAYTLAVYSKDATNLSGIIQTFETLDTNLVKVANTYAKTLQAVEIIVSYMEAIDEAKDNPVTANSNLFAIFNTALTAAFNSTSEFNRAKTDSPTLMTKSTDGGVESNVTSTTDINTLNTLFASLEDSKTSLPTEAAAVKTVVDGFVETKNALDKLLNDTGVDLTNDKVFTSRHSLLQDAKTKIDTMLASNSTSQITPTVFETFKNQLSSYYKVLLTLEKTRDVFYTVLSETDSTTVKNDPNTKIDAATLTSLFAEYTSFKTKFDALTAKSTNAPKALYHTLKSNLIDTAKRAEILAKARSWLLNLRTSIETINSGGNPNSIDQSSIENLRNLHQKVSSGYELLTDYFAYLDADFVGDPTVNSGKVETNNVAFELDSAIRGYGQGTNEINNALFTTLSNSIKELVAFNGLFDVNKSVPDKKLGILSNLFKKPTRENILSSASKIKNLQDNVLPAFIKAVGMIPTELSKIDSLTSWSIVRMLKDIEDETKLNLVKFNLLLKLTTYLFTNTDATKTELSNLINTFLGADNLNLLSSILNGGNSENEKLFADNYLQGLKSLAEKVSKIGDQFNIIDKLVVGGVDPSDTSVTITAENIDTIRNKYLDTALTMVDGTDDPTEISNLTTEITNDKIRTFILAEFGLQDVKNAIKDKITRKRFEVSISALSVEPLNSFNKETPLFKLIQTGLESELQPQYLKTFANLVIAQKELELAYNNYVLNVGSVTRATLFALERSFLETKRLFTELASSLTTFTASEQKLYNDIKATSDAVSSESLVVTSLQTYTEAPNNTNKADLDAKFSSLSATSKAKRIIVGFINAARAITDKVNTYYNNEMDLSATSVSTTNTVQVANGLLAEIEKLIADNASNLSPLFTSIRSTLQTLRANVIAQDEILNFLEFNSAATSGEPSFDTATNSIKNKSIQSTSIIDGDLRLVDSNPRLLSTGSKLQSIALKQLLDIVSVIQSSTDLINSGAAGFNYLGDPASLSLAKLAYSGPNGIKSIYDRFVSNAENWTNIVINNSNTRLKELANRVFEKIKALNQLSKVIFLFSAATSDVLGTDKDLIADDASFYDSFVKEYNVLKQNYQGYKSGRVSADATLSNFYNEKDDFWKSFDRATEFINTMHNDDSSGALDMLNNYLVNHINDNSRVPTVNASIIKLFDLNIPNKIENTSFANVGGLLLKQLSQTSVVVRVTTSIRSYYENIMEKGYRTFLGTNINDVKVRIDTNLQNFIEQFGTTNDSVHGSSWNSEVTIALQNDPRKVARLRNAVKSIQKFIEAMSNLQIVVDEYVKSPTEEKRMAALNSVLWSAFDAAHAEVESISKMTADDTISSSLVQFAEELTKLKEVQRNKIRTVQGLLVAATTNDISKLNFAAIPNPYEDQKTLLGDNFNLLNAIGFQVSDDNQLRPMTVVGSLLFGATRYRLSSDALVYQFINLKNPTNAVFRLPFNSGVTESVIDLDTSFPDKNANYFPVLFEVKKALVEYKNEELYKAENTEKLAQFYATLTPLLNNVKTLNFDHSEVDTDERALYNGVSIQLPSMSEAQNNINFEKVLADLIEFLIKKTEYDKVVKKFIVNPTQEAFAELQSARTDLTASRQNVKEARSTEEITAEAQLETTLDVLNEARKLFDTFESVPSLSNLSSLISAIGSITSSTATLSSLNANLDPAKKVFDAMLSKKANSLNIQLALIQAVNEYSSNPNETNKIKLEAELTKITALEESKVENSQEKLLLEQVTKVKVVIDAVVPLKIAYDAETFDGVLTNTLLLKATKEFNDLDAASKEDILIQTILNRVQAPLVTISSNRNIDRSLSEYVTVLTDENKTALNETIAKSKEDLGKIARNGAILEASDNSDVEKAATLASESIPSYISQEYIKAADEALATFKLFDQYKLNPSTELKTQIDKGIAKILLLKEAAQRLSLEIEKITKTDLVIDNKLEMLVTGYNAKFTEDNNFGTNVLDALLTRVNEIKNQRNDLTTARTRAFNALKILQDSSSSDLNALTTAQKALRDADLELKKFENLTKPFNNGQKLINPILQLRADTITLQITAIDSLRVYVEAKKTYSDKVYTIGQNIVKIANQKQRISNLITKLTKDAAMVAVEIVNLTAIENKSDEQNALLNTKTAESQQLKEQLTAQTTELTALETSESTLKTQLASALGEAVDEEMSKTAKAAAEKLLMEGRKLDAESLKSGITELSNETRLSVDSLNTIEILQNLQKTLTSYYSNPTEFITTNFDLLQRQIRSFEQIKKDVVTVLPKSIVDNLNETLSRMFNDLTAYADASRFIADPSDINNQKSSQSIMINKTLPDIANVIIELAKFNKNVNVLKRIITTENIENAQNAYNTVVSMLEKLNLEDFNESNDLTILQIQLKENVFKKSAEIIKAQFEIVKAINNFISSPSSDASAALSAARTAGIALQTLSENEGKFLALRELVRELKIVIDSSMILSNDAKNGLGDEVEKLIVKANADPTSLTPEEVVSIKNKLLVGDKTPPLDLIKTKLIDAINKLEADRRVAILIKDLNDAGSSTSTISINHGSDPTGFLNEDTKRVLEEKDKKVSEIDKAISTIRPDVIKTIEDATKEIERIKAIDETKRSDEDRTNLAKSEEIIKATETAKTAYDEKTTNAAEKTKAFTDAKTELDKLREKGLDSLTEDEKKETKEAPKEINDLRSKVTEAKEARDTNDREIKILEDKKTLILTPDERTKRTDLETSIKDTLEPALKTATDDLNTSKTKLDKIISDKAETVLNNEEKADLKTKKDSIPVTKNTYEEAKKALDDNKNAIEKVLLDKAPDVLSDRELRDYVSTKSEVGKVESDITKLNREKTQNEAEKTVLEAKPEGELSNAEKERIIELDAINRGIDTKLETENKKLEEANNKVKAFEDKIKESLNETEKTTLDELVGKTTELNGKVDEAKNNLNNLENSIKEVEKKVIDAFTPDEKAEYDKAKDEVDSLNKAKDKASDKLEDSKREAKAIEDKIDVSLSADERAKLKDLNNKKPELDKAVKDSEAELNAKLERIKELTKKANDALNEAEKAKFTELSEKVPTLEGESKAAEEEKATALNDLTKAEIDVSKKLADEKVEKHKETIKAKEAEIENSLLDVSETGKETTTRLKEELDKLNKELDPLVTEKEKIEGAKNDVTNLVSEREKIVGATDMIVAKNNEEIKKITDAIAAGSDTPPLSRVVGSAAEDSAKEATKVAIENGVAPEDARRNEILVDAIGAKNNLEEARRKFNENPTSGNQDELIKAIDKVNETNDELAKVDTENLPTTLKDNVKDLAKTNDLAKLEIDVINAARKTLSDSTPENNEKLKEVIDNAKTKLEEANKELETAKALPESDMTRDAKIKSATDRVDSAKRALDASTKLDRYNKTIEDLKRAKENLGKAEGGTTLETLDKISNDLALFNDDDADPVAKLFRDSAKKQIEDLKNAINTNESEAKLNEAIDKLDGETSVSTIKDFVSKLDKATKNNSSKAADLNTFKEALDAVNKAVDSYEKSDVANSDTIAAATKDINDAKDEVNKVLLNENASQAEKEVATKTIRQLDGLLKNLNEADSKQKEVTAILNESIELFGANPSDDNLDKLNDAIKKAEDARINTSDIKKIIDLSEKVKKLEEASNDAKVNFFDMEKRNELNKQLEDVKKDLAEVKMLAENNPEIKRISEIIGVKVDVVDTDSKIQAGDADSRAINREIDASINNINIDGPNKANEETLKSARDKILALPTGTEAEINIKNNLNEKLERTLNEIKTRDLIENLPLYPSATDISSIETLVNGSLGNFANLLEVIKLSVLSRDEIDNFRKANYSDLSVDEKIARLRSLSTSVLANVRNLSKSDNKTIADHAAKMLVNNESMKLLVDAETDLFEGISNANREKILSSKGYFEQLFAKDSTIVDKDQYEKLLDLVLDWDKIVKNAKDGNIRAIRDINWIVNSVSDLDGVSNVSLSSIIAQGESFDLGSSSKYKAAIAGTSVASAAAFSALAILLLFRKRRKKNRNIKK